VRPHRADRLPALLDLLDDPAPLHGLRPLRPPYERCAKTGKQIYVAEAENPKDYSPSYKCSFYKPKFTPRA
jgi:hypothetical protein